MDVRTASQIMSASLLCILPTLAIGQDQNTNAFDCVVTLECSQDGQCNAASETLAFTLKAKNVQRHGEGTYDLTYAGTTTDAQMLTPYGPIVWGGDDKLLTLTSLGELRDAVDASAVSFMTLSSVTISEPPTGTIKFLQCRDATP
jgi:hypothetical protein